MKKNALLLVLMFCLVTVGSLCAQVTPDVTVTMTFTGTLGPVLSGGDPLKGDGKSGTLTVMASESLSPITNTATSATYKLPAGAISVVIGGTTYKTTGPARMKITLPARGPDTVLLSATVQELGLTATVVGTVALKHGSFPASALQHPTTFSPSPQTLTAATAANGPGSKVKYTFLGGTTVLGIAGSASDSSAASMLSPDEEEIE